MALFIQTRLQGYYNYWEHIITYDITFDTPLYSRVSHPQPSAVLKTPALKRERDRIVYREKKNIV